LGCDGAPAAEQLKAEIPKVMRKLGLSRFEIPADVRVDDTIWTPESGA
jgi:hypothetical protein